jgi:hypothetical protein
MNSDDNSTLDAKVTTARIIVDNIVHNCLGFESEAWMAKFIAVQKVLAEGRLRDAVREESKLTRYDNPRKWIISGNLERRLESAMGVLHRHLSHPDHVEKAIVVEDLPTDVTSEGTHADVHEGVQRAFQKVFTSDPLDTDLKYEAIMAEASKRADDELAREGTVRVMGYCHAFWRRKKEILQRDYGLEWKTPAELYPGIRFD